MLWASKDSAGRHPEMGYIQETEIWNTSFFLSDMSALYVVQVKQPVIWKQEAGYDYLFQASAMFGIIIW